MTKKNVVRKILQFQCHVVKAKYEKMNFSEDQWFLQYSWTRVQRMCFKKMAIDFLRSNRRYMLLDLPYTIYDISKFIDGWIWDYGWKDASEIRRINIIENNIMTYMKKNTPNRVLAERVSNYSYNLVVI